MPSVGSTPNPCHAQGRATGMHRIMPADSFSPACRRPVARVLQGAVKRHFAGVNLPVIIYPFMLWSDGSQLNIGGVKFHAVLIMPANWPLPHLRSKKGYRRLALLPVVDPTSGSAPRTLVCSALVPVREGQNLTPLVVFAQAPDRAWAEALHQGAVQGALRGEDTVAYGAWQPCRCCPSRRVGSLNEPGPISCPVSATGHCHADI